MRIAAFAAPSAKADLVSLQCYTATHQVVISNKDLNRGLDTPDKALAVAYIGPSNATVNGRYLLSHTSPFLIIEYDMPKPIA